jgi:hypothetical protein
METRAWLGLCWLLGLLSCGLSLSHFTNIHSAATFSTLSDSKSDFEPYADNGGTVVAIAGSDYYLIAADTRLCDGYTIRSRNTPRIFQVSSLLYHHLLLSTPGELTNNFIIISSSYPSDRRENALLSIWLLV